MHYSSITTYKQNNAQILSAVFKLDWSKYSYNKSEKKHVDLIN